MRGGGVAISLKEGFFSPHILCKYKRTRTRCQMIVPWLLCVKSTLKGGKIKRKMLIKKRRGLCID